jgi:hypothetical protein
MIKDVTYTLGLQLQNKSTEVRCCDEVLCLIVGCHRLLIREILMSCLDATQGHVAVQFKGSDLLVWLLGYLLPFELYPHSEDVLDQLLGEVSHLVLFALGLDHDQRDSLEALFVEFQRLLELSSCGQVEASLEDLVEAVDGYHSGWKSALSSNLVFFV